MVPYREANGRHDADAEQLGAASTIGRDKGLGVRFPYNRDGRGSKPTVALASG